MTRVITAFSKEPGGIITKSDGQRWDALIYGSVTCDGTLMFHASLLKGVRDVASAFQRDHPEAFMGEEIHGEEHHRADMTYGKNAKVVTWFEAVPIRLNQQGEGAA